MMVVAFAGVGFSFTLFFGGNLRDALVATLAGALIRVVIQGMEPVSYTHLSLLGRYAVIWNNGGRAAP